MLFESIVRLINLVIWFSSALDKDSSLFPVAVRNFQADFREEYNWIKTIFFVNSRFIYLAICPSLALDMDYVLLTTPVNVYAPLT